MLCPNCSSPLDLVTHDNQKILHCGNCGGSFFEENGINRITITSAQALAEEKETNEVSGSEKKCPKDQEILKPLMNEAIPTDVALLKCSLCNGVFIYPDDLVRFKTAQEAKTNYYKAWSMPLPTIKAVLVLSLVAAIALSLFSLRQQQLTTSQATDVTKTIHANRSGPYLFLSFSTPIPLTSQILLIDKTTNTTFTKTVSPKPAKIHYLTTTDVNFNHQIHYQIILTDRNGKQTKTEELPLTIK